MYFQGVSTRSVQEVLQTMCGGEISAMTVSRIAAELDEKLKAFRSRSLKEMGYSISPASLRLDDLTPTIVSLLKQSGERTLTIAPETGSDRLRRVINKTITNDEIRDRAELIFSSGIENLKLYFMIGLPSETDEDLVAIRDLTIELREVMLRHARARGRIGRIVASGAAADGAGRERR